jgi:hypothetical protein
VKLLESKFKKIGPSIDGALFKDYTRPSATHSEGFTAMEPEFQGSSRDYLE